MTGHGKYIRHRNLRKVTAGHNRSECHRRSRKAMADYGTSVTITEDHGYNKWTCHGRSRKVTEGYGKSRKVTEGHGRLWQVIWQLVPQQATETSLKVLSQIDARS